MGAGWGTIILMQLLWEQQRAEGFPALAGAVVEGSVPLRERVLNEVITALVAQRGGGALRDAQVSLPGGTRVVAQVTVEKFLLRKTLTVEMDIDPRIDFARSPLLVLTLAQSPGLLGFVIEIVIGMAGLPPGTLTMSGQRITVNLRTLMEKAGQGDLANLIQTIGFTGEPGLLFVHFHIESTGRR